MSALEHIYGVGYEVDANGKPIERGFGNMTDRAKAAAAEVAPAPPVPTVATVASVPEAGVALRTDGPTIAEWMAAGYVAVNYPPHGYEAKSTPDEVAAAVLAAHAQPAKPETAIEAIVHKIEAVAKDAEAAIAAEVAKL